MTAVTQITTAYLNYKLRETGNTLESIGVSLSNGSSSLCNRKLGSTGCQLVVFWFYSHRKARLSRLLFKPIPALTMLLFVEDFWIVCSRSASFWLDAEVVHVNFCLLGSSMYVDIRFAIFSDLLQTHCCIITNRLHAIINLTPFKQTDRRLHLLSSSWCIQVASRRTTEWSQTWSPSVKQSFQMQQDYKSIVSLVLNIQSDHIGPSGCSKSRDEKMTMFCKIHSLWCSEL